MRIKIVTSIFLLVLILSGCGTSSNRDSSETLEEVEFKQYKVLEADFVRSRSFVSKLFVLEDVETLERYSIEVYDDWYPVVEGDLIYSDLKSYTFVEEVK